MSFKTFLRTAAVCTAVFAITGCGSTYYLKHNTASTEFSSQQKATLTSKKFAVPCRVEIICPDDLTGTNGSSVCHYPLKKILADVFSNATYAVFEQPAGEVIDAFTVKVEVFKSELDMDEETYSLHLLVTLEEPGEKKILTLRADKMMHGECESETMVPDLVYSAAKELAVDVMKDFRNNPKVLRTVSRFEKK